MSVLLYCSKLPRFAREGAHPPPAPTPFLCPPPPPPPSYIPGSAPAGEGWTRSPDSLAGGRRFPYRDLRLHMLVSQSFGLARFRPASCSFNFFSWRQPEIRCRACGFISSNIWDICDSRRLIPLLPPTLATSVATVVPYTHCPYKGSVLVMAIVHCDLDGLVDYLPP